MKSPRRLHRPKRSRWAHANTPEALRRRRAAADAKRESIAARMPPTPTGPDPLSVWQTVTVCGADGQVQHCITLYVPTSGRCDQHAVTVDGARLPLATATEIGRMVAGMLHKRPSVALLADARRDGWMAARNHL